ncbi:hypothetical protein TNCV_2740641 [Trichonephila clavipes]|nr:hypothetical protein TNCV_2740641 [Trichonephila clavipes]
MTRTTSEMANPSPNYHTTPTGRCLSLDRFNNIGPLQGGSSRYQARTHDTPATSPLLGYRGNLNNNYRVPKNQIWDIEDWFFVQRGCGSPVVKGIGSWQACHEFEPSTTEYLPGSGAMHVKSAELKRPPVGVVVRRREVPTQVSFSSLDHDSKNYEIRRVGLR